MITTVECHNKQCKSRFPNDDPVKVEFSDGKIFVEYHLCPTCKEITTLNLDVLTISHREWVRDCELLLSHVSRFQSREEYTKMINEVNLTRFAQSKPLEKLAQVN